MVYEKDGALQDKEGNKYNAEVDADGVHLSKQGSDKSYYGKWQKGSNSVGFTQQSGFLAGFEFAFGPKNPHWRQDAQGTFTYRGTLAAAQAALEAAGFDRVFGIQPGDDFKSSGGPDRSNASHFIIKSGGSVPVTGTLHTGESRGLKHVPEAIVNVFETLTREHLGGIP